MSLFKPQFNWRRISKHMFLSRVKSKMSLNRFESTVFGYYGSPFLLIDSQSRRIFVTVSVGSYSYMTDTCHMFVQNEICIHFIHFWYWSSRADVTQSSFSYDLPHGKFAMLDMWQSPEIDNIYVYVSLGKVEMQGSWEGQAFTTAMYLQNWKKRWTQLNIADFCMTRLYFYYILVRGNILSQTEMAWLQTSLAYLMNDFAVNWRQE